MKKAKLVKFASAKGEASVRQVMERLGYSFRNYEDRAEEAYFSKLISPVFAGAGLYEKGDEKLFFHQWFGKEKDGYTHPRDYQGVEMVCLSN